MIVRTHTSDTSSSEAVFSDCGLYRYSLTRVWDADAPRVLFIMLNPSKADEIANDPTVERCERRARALGYGAFRVTNIFAWRDTDPKALKRAKHPEGPENKSTLVNSATWANDIVAAWGAHGEHRGQGAKIQAWLRCVDTPVLHLGLTKAGHPRHPLYISYATQPTLWQH